MPIVRYKVLIVQTDSTELAFQTELGLDANKVYFNAAGFASDDTQAAILEAISKSGSARTTYGGYYDANAGTGRWLEISKGVSSQTSPHVIPEAGVIKAITISVKSNSTCTITIYKNGSSIHTISLSAEQTKVISSLSTSLVSTDELSYQVTSGSCQEPNLQVHVQVAA